MSEEDGVYHMIFYLVNGLNCQMQSHLSWLVVIPLGQKSPLQGNLLHEGISTLSGHFYRVMTIL